MNRKRSKSARGASLATLAGPYAPTALAELVRIMTRSRSDHARVAACNALLDRGFGKPPPAQSLATKDIPRPPRMRDNKFIKDSANMSLEEAQQEYRRLRDMPLEELQQEFGRWWR